MSVNTSIMKKKNILVVGGAGYIGSHMVKDLLKAGYGVITLDDFSTGHRDLLPGGKLFEGNLGDSKLLDKIFSNHPITTVCLGVLPVYFSKTNVNENVMAAVIKMVKKVFLFFNIFIHISGESDCLIRVSHDLN